jgi:dTDP-4-dehydrorhamnose 3,5-epimerase
MQVTATKLPGLVLIEPRVFSDERGFFLETYQTERYKAADIRYDFVQDNQSRSAKGVLRGLHFQVKRPQAQILTVLRGRVFDVVVDLRRSSPTFMRWAGVELSDEGLRQVYMAPGLAHGFCVLSEVADLHYKVSRVYDPSDEAGIVWNDTDIGIDWPVTSPIVSSRDAAFPRVRDLRREQFPHVEELNEID